MLLEDGDLTFLAVFGHVNIDVKVQLGRLPSPGKSAEVLSRGQVLGGTAANISMNAATLGIPTALATYVGRDFPKQYVQMLRASGVDLKDLKFVKDGDSPVCFVLTDKDQNQMYFIDQGVQRDLESRPLLERAVRRSKCIHISTGRPGYYIRIAKLAKELGKRVYMDPGQEIHFLYDRKNIRGLIEHCDGFFGNTLEAVVAVKLLGGKKVSDLLNYVDVAIITDGKKGSKVYTKEKVHTIPVIKKADIADPTGAGDAYRAGFYSGLMRGLGYQECGLLGSAAASVVVRNRGNMKALSWKTVNALAKASLRE